MKYIIKNPENNVIEMMFETPMIPSEGIIIYDIPNEQWRSDMLRSIWTDINNYKPYPKTGTFWESDGKNWVDARPSNEVWETVRKKRNEKLLQSDWTQLNDSQLNPLDKGLWTAYRQKLRQIPNDNPTNPRAAEVVLKNINKPTTSRST